jgi:lipoprotein NlpI
MSCAIREGLSVLLLSLFVAAVSGAETAAQLLQSARTALMNGQTDQALKLIGEAIASEPKNPAPFLLRAAVREAQGKPEEALADLNQVLLLDPKHAEAFDRRGSVHFKLGKFAASLSDFDKFLALSPKDSNGHWRRGITCYYAGAFDEGRKQFEGYEKVDTNDVENAIWHFLCVARASGVEKARESLLKIGKDGRVPMMEVYALYAGKIKPEEVLAAAQGGNPPAEKLSVQLFYAHLYLGLYYEVMKDPKKAQEHMALAAEKYKIRHYMGDVAVVHLRVLREKK